MAETNDSELNRRIEQFEARVEEERQRVREVDDKLAAQLTNILIAGSIGAILASITFVKDIAPNPVAGSLIHLRIAWFALFAASVLSIASLVTNRVAARHFRDLLYARYQRADCTGPENRCNRWNRATKTLNGTSMVLLAVGSGFLIWFANVNLPEERKPNERSARLGAAGPGVLARAGRAASRAAGPGEQTWVRLRPGGSVHPLTRDSAGLHPREGAAGAGEGTA